MNRDRKLRPLSPVTFSKKVAPGSMTPRRSDQSKNAFLHFVADENRYKSTKSRPGSVECVSHTDALEQGRSWEHRGYSRVPLNRTMPAFGGIEDFSFSGLVTKFGS